MCGPWPPVSPPRTKLPYNEGHIPDQVSLWPPGSSGQAPSWLWSVQAYGSVSAPGACGPPTPPTPCLQPLHLSPPWDLPLKVQGCKRVVGPEPSAGVPVVEKPLCTSATPWPGRELSPGRPTQIEESVISLPSTRRPPVLAPPNPVVE